MLKAWVIAFLNGGKEGVTIDMGDGERGKLWMRKPSKALAAMIAGRCIDRTAAKAKKTRQTV